jgi:hypothetical protein
VPDEIGPDEQLSRHVWNPPMLARGMEFLYVMLFEFPDGQPESLIWHRFVSGGIDGVHLLGCARQREKRAEQVADNRNPDKTYIGAMTAQSGDILVYRNPNGHGFRLEPDESEGQGKQHVSICYDSQPDSKPLTKPDKAELKLRLCEIFGEIAQHECPE